ncbi:hypothetical protein EVAR_23632_1 [Eumeta japonica]|uniref:Uncharacterized protein n=1 Tax=Eumeta variegata TaxID=151549 RepID=A0A4C1VH34_EUMVA|nr:hypothetical protein EVAR_23632_1 [Eumeta japonica]
MCIINPSSCFCTVGAAVELVFADIGACGGAGAPPEAEARPKRRGRPLICGQNGMELKIAGHPRWFGVRLSVADNRRHQRRCNVRKRRINVMPTTALILATSESTEQDVI